MVQGLKRHSGEESLRDLAVFSMGKRKLVGDLGNVCKYVMGGNEEESLLSSAN